MSDVVVVGAGVVGSACAYFAARAGLSVTLLDRGAVGAGTTSRGEGNILVSDKAPGAELQLALWSRTLWLQIAADLGAQSLELEQKGGLVVASTESERDQLREFAAQQSEAGVATEYVSAGRLCEHEPHLSDRLSGGVRYAQDLQVQPILAAAAMAAAARSYGAKMHTGVEVTGLERGNDGRVAAVLAGSGRFPAAAVVNAAGTWGGAVSAAFGAPVPVLPRRGFILVTEPLPQVVRHKVYSAGYVGNVASDDEGLETSVVVEGTRAGTVLIGASRERVGFDPALSVDVIRRQAEQAVTMFPVLAGVRLLRVYHGFRPYCPDHLPVIGADARVPGLFHACGHEGAGVGLAPATGSLITQLIQGADPGVDPAPFSPARIAQAAA